LPFDTINALGIITTPTVGDSPTPHARSAAMLSELQKSMVDGSVTDHSPAGRRPMAGGVQIDYRPSVDVRPIIDRSRANG
jgi:hypothetical protein